jgi:protein-S-isoprenylcysteine O-methyltransferase Ste14
MWKHLRAILLLPGVVTLLVPALLLWLNRPFSPDWPPPFNGLALAAGVLLIGPGLWLMTQTIRLFATAGQGTLAPWDPTRRLVVQGIYRHVRNPMITGVGCVLLGEALLFRSPPLLYWFLAFALLNLIYIPWLEERGLERRFGEDYRLYRQNVPRWLPRRGAWQPPWQH